MYAFLLATVILTGADDESTSIEAIEDAVVSYRRSIRQMHVVWHQTVQRRLNRGEAPAKGEGRTQITTLWLDPDHLRVDVEAPGTPERPGSREFTCRNCEAKGTIVRSDGIPHSAAPLQFNSIAEAPATADADDAGRTPASLNNLGLPDPRLLGLQTTMSGNLCHFGFESLVGRRDRENATVTPAMWEGRPCSLIAFDLLARTGRVGVKFWVVPEWGPSIARIETTEGRLADSVSMTYEQDADSGIWYPKDCTYERKKDGVLSDREIVNVDLISLNQEIDPDVFRLRGLGVPVGTPVSGLPEMRSGNSYVWTGSEIEEVKEESPGALDRLPPAKEGVGRLLKVNAILFGLIAAFCLWRYLRRVREQGS